MTTSTSSARDAVGSIDIPAQAEFDSPARRLAFAPPTLAAPVDHVAIIGDSLYFESSEPAARTNTIVPLLRTALRTSLGDPDFRVRNLSRPGLAIKYPHSTERFEFIALADWLPIVFGPGSNNPELVVIAATSIDLNIKAETPIGELAPALVAELRVIVAQIEALDIEVLVTPAFPINDEMFDGLMSVSNGREIHADANARVSELNRQLAASDLPMLFPGYRGVDLDFDGDADETNYTNFHADTFPDDGIHTNAVGERLIADHLARFLLEVLEPT